MNTTNDCKLSCSIPLLFALPLLLACHVMHAVETPSALQTHAESDFWEAFNRCDLDRINSLLAADMEFYHDRDGALIGAQEVTQSIAENLCAGANPELRRELVANSQTPHPIPGYGTLVVGEHVFYAMNQQGAETLAGQAKFSHLWRNDADGIKLTRVLSYAHGSPVRIVGAGADQPALALSAAQLAAYVGEYRSEQTGAIEVAVVNGQLQVSSGDFQSSLVAVAEHQFRSTQAPLVFDFGRDPRGKINGFELFENGAPVDSASRQ